MRVIAALIIALSAALSGEGDSWLDFVSAGADPDAESIVVEAVQQQRDEQRRHQDGSGPNNVGDGVAEPPPPTSRLTGNWNCYDGDLASQGGNCVDRSRPEEEPAEPVIPGVVTLTDIASFVPAGPSVATEPDGIAAKNMPMNSIATSAAHTAYGDLFGLPVSVAFTPAGFRQDWGDGAVTESSTGGARWSALGQAEYTPTATSHAYAAKGTYSLAVTALYTAVVDFGPYGLRPVDGVVSARGAARDIRVVEVHTALVQSDCTENPVAAGCSR